VYEIRIASHVYQTFPWSRTRYTWPFGEMHGAIIEIFTSLSIASSGIHRVGVFVGTKDEFAEGL
jgi:hypothetical protein